MRGDGAQCVMITSLMLLPRYVLYSILTVHNEGCFLSLGNLCILGIVYQTMVFTLNVFAFSILMEIEVVPLRILR